MSGDSYHEMAQLSIHFLPVLTAEPVGVGVFFGILKQIRSSTSRKYSRGGPGPWVGDGFRRTALAPIKRVSEWTTV